MLLWAHNSLSLGSEEENMAWVTVGGDLPMDWRPHFPQNSQDFSAQQIVTSCTFLRLQHSTRSTPFIQQMSSATKEAWRSNHPPPQPPWIPSLVPFKLSSVIVCLEAYGWRQRLLFRKCLSDQKRNCLCRKNRKLKKKRQTVHRDFGEA